MKNVANQFLYCLLLAFSISCGEKETSAPTPEISADFITDKTVIREGESVQFSDFSSGSPTSWVWTFDGGTPATSNGANPVVTYHEAGVYSVTLLASNDEHEESITRTSLINVKCAGRYCEPIFEVEKTEGGIYGVDPEFHTFNWYEPKNDSETARAAVVLMGGGRFENLANLDRLEELALLLAERGVLVATATSRIGPRDTGEEFNCRMIEVQQDALAAIRYFHKEAEALGIDPDLIFSAGYSSGAIATLRSAYWQEQDILDIGAIDVFDEKGGVEGEQGNPGYPTTVAGTICLAGEMYGTVGFIKNGEPPLFAVCSSHDNEVTCDESTSAGSFPKYGAIALIDKANSVGISPNNYYIFNSSDHRIVVEQPEAYFEQLMVWMREVISNQSN